MSMTIGEASDVATLLHWIAGDVPVEIDRAVDALTRLNTRAAKPVQLARILDDDAVVDATERLARVRTLHVLEGRDGLWYWHAKALNGEITAASENYTRRADAIRAATTEYPGGTRTWEAQEDEQP